MADEETTEAGLEGRPWFVRLRAILVLLHVVAISVAAAPAPVGALTPVTRNAQSTKALFAEASDVTGLPAADLEAATWGFVEGWLDARSLVLTPFQPYYEHAGTHQSWRMMALINRRPARLRVELDGELAYRTGDPDARWMAEVLESSRVRGIIIKYSWKMNRTDYKWMMDWLAVQAKEQRGPDTSFRACLERVQVALPGEETRELGCGWEVLR